MHDGEERLRTIAGSDNRPSVRLMTSPKTPQIVENYKERRKDVNRRVHTSKSAGSKGTVRHELEWVAEGTCAVVVREEFVRRNSTSRFFALYLMVT